MPGQTPHEIACEVVRLAAEHSTPATYLDNALQSMGFVHSCYGTVYNIGPHPGGPRPPHDPFTIYWNVRTLVEKLLTERGNKHE